MVMVVSGGLELLSAKFDNIGRLKRLKHLTHVSQPLSSKITTI